MSNARVALKYIVLALSGHMDDVMAKYKVWFLFSPPSICCFMAVCSMEMQIVILNRPHEDYAQLHTFCFQDVKHQILFLLEILEPFLDPALTPLKSLIAFGNVSQIFPDSQEQNCTVALNVIRKAVTKSAILPSLESEWRRGSVAPM